MDVGARLLKHAKIYGKKPETELLNDRCVLATNSL